MRIIESSGKYILLQLRQWKYAKRSGGKNWAWKNWYIGGSNRAGYEFRVC